MSQRFGSLRRVRGDNYCALRATLFQLLSHSTQLPTWLQDEDFIMVTAQNDWVPSVVIRDFGRKANVYCLNSHGASNYTSAPQQPHPLTLNIHYTDIQLNRKDMKGRAASSNVCVLQCQHSWSHPVCSLCLQLPKQLEAEDRLISQWTFPGDCLQGDGMGDATQQLKGYMKLLQNTVLVQIPQNYFYAMHLHWGYWYTQEFGL